jgi:hypothetical protein
MKDGGSEVFLHKHKSYYKASGGVENDKTHSQISTIVYNHSMEG